jgi:hypothetical protein
MLAIDAGAKAAKADFRHNQSPKFSYARYWVIAHTILRFFPAVLRRLAPNVILKEATEVSSRDEFERSGWDDGHYSPLPG